MRYIAIEIKEDSIKPFPFMWYKLWGQVRINNQFGVYKVRNVQPLRKNTGA